MDDIKNIYTSPHEPSSFSSPLKIQRALKIQGKEIPLSHIKKWLKGNDTYTKHRVARTVYKRNPVISTQIDAQWQGDLADMSNLKAHNDNVTFLLVLIDIVSKYLWVEPLKSKSGPSVVKAFENIWSRTNRRPRKLQTDDGKEFLYSGVQNMLQNMDIHFFTIKSDKKASVAERVIRTLKEKIWRYLHEKHTRRYLDVLQDLVNSYNQTYHNAIKMAPDEVNEDNETDVLYNLYGELWRSPQRINPKRPKFHIGEMVRISHVKRVFKKGYTGNWTEEIFRVSGIKRDSEPRIVYKLEDWLNNPIEGTFYEDELQSVDKDVSGFWKVEKILGTRTSRGRIKEYLVKWEGYPNSMNSWVQEGDIKSI